MNNYEYVQENIQGQNIFDGDSNTSPDIDQLNQIINENMTNQTQINPMNISYCSSHGSAYFPIESNVIPNSEDLFNNSNKIKSIIEIKVLRDCIYDILNKTTSFEDEEYNDVDFKDEKIEGIIKDINNYIKQFEKIQEEIYEIDKELKKEIESINKNINKLDNIIQFLLNLDIKGSDNNEEDKDMKNMVESIKIVSKKISKTENFNELKKKYVAKRKELNKYIHLLKNINKLNISNRCPICMDSILDNYLDPCGHTMCKSCIERSIKRHNNHLTDNIQLDIYSIRDHHTPCPICRKLITNIRPLFIL